MSNAYSTGYISGGLCSGSSIETFIAPQFELRDTTLIKSLEKDNKKINLYRAIGFNKDNITVEKNFVNKTKTLSVTIKGNFKEEDTGYENNLNINLNVDYNVYDQVTWKICDGILTVTMHEIKNEEPKLYLYEE